MSTFDRRRRLTRQDLLTAAGAAVGVGIGVGMVTFYAMRLMLQREPLRPPPGRVPGAPEAPDLPPPPSPAPSRR